MKFESRNPATGELLGTYPEHNKAEIEVRLQRAWDGWRNWSRTPLRERIAFLTRLAELLEERAGTYGSSNHRRDGQAAGGLHFRDQEIRLGRPPPRRRGGGLSQAAACPRRTGADNL